MTSARALSQAAAAGPVGCPPAWPWLQRAAEMAAAGRAISCPGRGGGWPRVATRTPGATASAAAAARDFAAATLQRWAVGSRSDDIILVLSELVTNALRHAAPQPGDEPVRVGLLQAAAGSAVLCAVADPSPRAPVLRAPAEDAVCGRGLHVVAVLSDHWGWTAPGHRGKTVWAAFAGG